jgi:ubiquinone/menaquinone biosynthesis C-methylase UbiE
MHKQVNVSEQSREFLPAAGVNWLLPFYDPIVKLLGGNRLRRKLVQQADIKPEQNVLEIGCGTGSVLMLIKEVIPNAQVTGLDPDPGALKRANRKAKKKNAEVRLVEGFSDDLPYPEAFFDRVLSSFMFHHLPEEEKTKTLVEVQRVLKAGGTFHMLDFEKVETKGNWLHSSKQLKDNTEQRILSLLKTSGFTEARKTGTDKMLLMHVAYYMAYRD